MNPFAWLAIALGFLFATGDEEESKTKGKKPITELKDLPKGTTIDIGEGGEVDIKPPSSVPAPEPKTPPTPKPKPPVEEGEEEDYEEDYEDEESLPDEIEDWLDVVDQGLPYFDWLLEQGEDWLEDDADYDDEYYDGEYYDDDYYYEDYEDWYPYDWEDDYQLIE